MSIHIHARLCCLQLAIAIYACYDFSNLFSCNFFLLPSPLQVSMLRDPAVLVPVLCAATVVILLISAVSLLFMRNRRGHPHGHSNDICKCSYSSSIFLLTEKYDVR